MFVGFLIQFCYQKNSASLFHPILMIVAMIITISWYSYQAYIGFEDCQDHIRPCEIFSLA